MLGHNQEGSNSVNITPYAAYVINDNFFISALTGYLFTNTAPNYTQQSNLHANVSEVDFNALDVVDNWFMKGRIGGRYQHSDILTDGSMGVKETSTTNDIWTYLTEGTIGHSFDADSDLDGLKLYTGLLYELSTGTRLNMPATLSRQDNSTLYYNAGFDYSIGKASTVGMSLQTDLDNRIVDLTSVAFNLRLALD